MGLARASVHDLNPDDVLVPPGFARVLGNSVADNEESPPRVDGRAGRPRETSEHPDADEADVAPVAAVSERSGE